MKRLSLIFLLMLLAFTACKKLSVAGGEASLGIYIETPGEPFTRAEVGDVPGTTAENAVHNILVWIFDSDTHQLIDTLNLSGSQLPSPGRVRRYELPVSTDFAREKPAVDVFAIANAASIGCTLDNTSSWDDVNDAVICDPYFGVDNPVRSIDATQGLPMTGVGRNLAIQGEEPMLKIETVKLVRAVSKLRFVFCRMANEQEQDDIRIERVTLNGNQIPASEYLFLASETDKCAIDQSEGYELSPIVTPGPATIAPNETPEKLVYAGQDPASYEAMLNNAIAEGTLTDCGVLYLRESNKILKGSIDYSINGESHSRNFMMANEYDFARNHTWTLYGYFLSGRNLQLSVRTLPWDYGKWTVNFSNDAVLAEQIVVDANTVEIVETSHDHFDCHLRPGITAKCSVYITSPVSGKLMVRAIGDTYAFLVDPRMADINPDVDAGRIDISIRRNPEAQGDLTGKFITLSFYVELGEREIDADTEIFNGEVYRFIL